MGESGNDIIIKGGSVELEFNDDVYQKDPNDPKMHRNPNKKITQVVVKDTAGAVIYDSGDNPNGLRYTVTATCK